MAGVTLSAPEVTSAGLSYPPSSDGVGGNVFASSSQSSLPRSLHPGEAGPASRRNP
eukprot:CAMPEP_0172568370 /NCGR_PEP_ID=MMETSP1067-20121228/119719_1 /TAXON_ID=265564 ORGANISM="Thalassiosira punctigera, Strain Tpunct2005C2" /NCGR_SAMPLE_ID=MMETSP1067 /ASSEMBLY_ACC=CAM_ASM_000444 /LENGTH=55 /DNA_ID=CAMNT_0013359953 /DNA_START=132 /DNA_END=296 /DNA_ORIENTATION=+